MDNMDKVTLPTKSGLIEATQYDEVCQELALLKQQLIEVKKENQLLHSQNNTLKETIETFSNFDQQVEQKTKQEVESKIHDIRAEFTTEIASINQIVTSYQGELTYELSKHVHDIIFVAISKILGSLLTKREVPFAIVQKVIEKIGPQKNIIIKVAPQELLLIERYQSRLPAIANFKLIADDSVKLGGCIIELDHAIFDGRIEAQLEAIHQSLNDARSPIIRDTHAG
ncbi:FliH/SctL family protein [Marinicellulosiphila megalodicopiae]|uniref:FliH/SctL family protein n=1 Tax=Marinicellulosiphila megalodicopiae TaxID=2724896 RepID=UPI003BB03FCB